MFYQQIPNTVQKQHKFSLREIKKFTGKALTPKDKANQE